MTPTPASPRTTSSSGSAVTATIPITSTDARWKKAASLIESKYVHDGLRRFCKSSLQFGIVGESLGYFRITNFFDYADPEGYANALQCLDQTLDAIFTGAPLRGLIIDVRLNRGGDDPLGIAIAARLTDKKYLAYTKVTRNSLDLNAPLRYTEPQPSWVLPSARPVSKGKSRCSRARTPPVLARPLR